MHITRNVEIPLASALQGTGVQGTGVQGIDVHGSSAKVPWQILTLGVPPWGLGLQTVLWIRSYMISASWDVLEVSESQGSGVPRTLCTLANPHSGSTTLRTRFANCPMNKIIYDICILRCVRSLRKSRLWSSKDPVKVRRTFWGLWRTILGTVHCPLSWTTWVYLAYMPIRQHIKPLKTPVLGTLKDSMEVRGTISGLWPI